MAFSLYSHHISRCWVRHLRDPWCYRTICRQHRRVSTFVVCGSNRRFILPRSGGEKIRSCMLTGIAVQSRVTGFYTQQLHRIWQIHAICVRNHCHRLHGLCRHLGRHFQTPYTYRMLTIISSRFPWITYGHARNWKLGTVATSFFQYAYSGYDNVNNVLDEVKDPVRTLRTAAPAAMITIIFFYVLLNMAYR